jgi:Protein of unknown function (DUF2721)
MPAESPIADVAHVIQLSVAPVFLLTAVGAILGVLSTRLGRIVDRSRVLADRLSGLSPEARPPLELELALLRRRRHLVNMAITCGTCAALMVAGVIASAFLGFLLGWRVAGAVAVLFILAMLFVMAALLLFLREIFIAATRVQIGGPPGAR